jgi:hypothetical protein
MTRASKGKVPVWVEIIFKDSSTPKRHEDHAGATPRPKG